MNKVGIGQETNAGAFIDEAEKSKHSNTNHRAVEFRGR
jgi:hypothetical protein